MRNRSFPLLTFCFVFVLGTFGCSSEDTGVEPDETGRYSLGDVSPNPAKDQTTLSYSIGETAHVLIRLYNQDGEVLDTLLDAKLDSGDYVLEIDVSELENGLYAVRLESGGWTASTQLIVQR